MPVWVKVQYFQFVVFLAALVVGVGYDRINHAVNHTEPTHRPRFCYPRNNRDPQIVPSCDQVEADWARTRPTDPWWAIEQGRS